MNGHGCFLTLGYSLIRAELLLCNGMRQESMSIIRVKLLFISSLDYSKNVPLCSSFSSQSSSSSTPFLWTCALFFISSEGLHLQRDLVEEVLTLGFSYFQKTRRKRLQQARASNVVVDLQNLNQFKIEKFYCGDNQENLIVIFWILLSQHPLYWLCL